MIDKTSMGDFRKGLFRFFFVMFFVPPVILLFFPLGDRIRQIATTPVWNVGIYRGETPLDPQPSVDLPAPVFTPQSMRDLQVRLIADPFLIREGEAWYLFFEVVGKKSEKGEIGFAQSEDLVHWKYGGIILAEPFHLSYPYVFRWENEIYMIPETSAIHSVLLYRAEAFPAKWALVKTLIRAEGISDPSIFQVNKKWWLYGGDVSCQTLRLYYADDLKGPWREHPQSPIIQGNLFFSRPAGRIIQWDGKILRFAQQDIPWYGKQVWALEVLTLTEDRYEERVARDTPLLQAAGGGAWNGQGMHHADLHERADGKWVAAVDGFRDHRSIGIFLNKVRDKFQRACRYLFRGNNDS